VPQRTDSHLLLISEDQGNEGALEQAKTHLSHGSQVTWICSTPVSRELTQLESMLALKNSYMAALNLLVITRDEKQPFDVLTGTLDSKRLERCAEELFDLTTVTHSTIACPPGTQDELGRWLESNLENVTVNRLSTVDISNNQPSTASNTKDNVAVTLILQGRERSFEMERSAGTLLEGAEDAGIDLPFSCRGGVCSTCRARLASGKVELRENYALEDSEKKESNDQWVTCMISPWIRLTATPLTSPTTKIRFA